MKKKDTNSIREINEFETERITVCSFEYDIGILAKIFHR